ncbi:MAG: ctaA [Bacteriovoracaceae bacterium]|nr:ctaA [Bacteriovoracaceae bacterium]
MAIPSLPTPWTFRLQQILCGVLFFLIVLGAGVRLANAGLACPDWPLCLGKAVPTFDFKIFMEWIHRVVAMSSGILALIVSVSVWSNPKLRGRLGFLCVLSLLLFVLQAFLGRQTVLEFLNSDKVTAHLMGGYSLLALNTFIFLKWRGLNVGEKTLRWGFLLMLILTFFQATLGGTVSSHYAGLACPDFPKCNGQWWPEFAGAIGFHFMHRLGAFVLLTLSVLLTVGTFSKNQEKSIRRLSLLGSLLIALQIIWGVLMIFNAIHPALSLAHSATALSIFMIYLIGAYRAFHP